MASLFCCSKTQPYRPQTLSHEPKFRTFMKWASFPTESTIQTDKKPVDLNYTFVIQLVRQVNFGALESKRYFVVDESNDAFLKTTEADLIEANYEKLNAYVLFDVESCNEALLRCRPVIRTSSVLHTIDSLRSMCTRRMRSMRITGVTTLLVLVVRSICRAIESCHGFSPACIPT